MPTATIDSTVRNAANQLLDCFPQWKPPTLLVQLGNGFRSNGLLDDLGESRPLACLDGIPESRDPTQQPPTMRLGYCNERQVLLLQGHHYLHEGLGVAPCTIPIYAAALAGVRNVVLVESALTLREDLKPGSWLALTDYINNQGIIPLAGCNDVVKGVFADMTEAYSQALNAELINALANVGIFPRLGIYQGNLGPQFETPAEVETARRNGADVVGHGVIAETVAAATAGCSVSALILVADVAPSYRGKRITHRDVMDAVEFCSTDMMRGLRRALCEGDLFGAGPGEDDAIPPEPETDLRLGVFQ